MVGRHRLSTRSSGRTKFGMRLPPCRWRLNRDRREMIFCVLMLLLSNHKHSPVSSRCRDRTLAMFVTETERAFARLLDALHISWEYEPEEFVLERKVDGSVKTAFRPDFHLPELGLYVELTMQKTAYNTRKNRKIRLLAEQRPDVQIVLLGRKELAVLPTPD